MAKPPIKATQYAIDKVSATVARDLGLTDRETDRPNVLLLASDWKPRWGYMLTIGKHPTDPDKMLAIIHDGSPQYAQDPVTVLSLEVVNNETEAKHWYKETMRTKPWLPRN